MRIMRESETGGDAVGNTEVALTGVTDPETIRRHYPKERIQHSSDGLIELLVTGTHSDEEASGEQSAGKKMKPIDVLPQVPVPHCALRARVRMLYEERKVENGREFYDEAKQSVTLLRDAEDKQDLDIMSADEVSPAVWSLRLLSCDKDGRCTEEEVLKAQQSVTDAPNPSLWRNVVFTDYGVAIRTALWLRTHPGETLSSGYRFNYPIGADGKTYASLVPVKKTADECKAPPSVTAMVAHLKQVAARRSGGQRLADAGGQPMSER